jgi:hypothetical protein
MLFRFIRAFWLSLVGAALFFYNAVWPGIRWLLDWAGNLDFIASRIADPGWVGVVIEWVLDPPGWASALLAAAGLAFITWDVRRVARRSVVAPSVLPAEERPDGAAAPSMSDAQVSTIRVEDDPAELSNRIYLGRIEADTHRVLSDYYLEFSFVAYNANPVQLKLEGVRGFSSYASNSSVPIGDSLELPAAVGRQDNPTDIEPFSEFRIAVTQRVPGEIAPGIGEDLASGGRVRFAFEKLDITLARADGSRPFRLPIWERVTCERMRAGTSVLRNIVVNLKGFIG